MKSIGMGKPCNSHVLLLMAGSLSTHRNVVILHNLNFFHSPLGDWRPLENNQSALVVTRLLVRAEFDLCHLLRLIVSVVDGGNHWHFLLLLHVAVGCAIGVPRAGAAAGRHLWLILTKWIKSLVEVNQAIKAW